MKEKKPLKLKKNLKNRQNRKERCTWHFGAPWTGQEFQKSGQMRYHWIRLGKTNRMAFYGDM